MNIFKVLASAPRGSFQEEHASVLLAWLLRPDMDHGLGYEVLVAFLRQLAVDDKLRQVGLEVLADGVAGRVGITQGARPQVEVYLERNAGGKGRFVDIVLVVDGWVFVIENKIRLSAVDQGLRQLQEEYRGMCVDDLVTAAGATQQIGRRRVVMVYLIPAENEHTGEEMAGVRSVLHDGDLAVKMLWGSNDPEADAVLRCPVLTGALREVLAHHGTTLHENVRHTLCALLDFVGDGFVGYPTDVASARSGGTNPATESRQRLPELMVQRSGYVGVAGGISGLLRDIQNGEIAKGERRYQFTTKEAVADSTNWLPIGLFQQIANALHFQTAADFGWIDGQLLLPGATIRWMAEHWPDQFTVGARGGETSLAERLRRQVADDGTAIRSDDRWYVREGGDPGGRPGDWMLGSRFLSLVRSAEGPNVGSQP